MNDNQKSAFATVINKYHELSFSSVTMMVDNAAVHELDKDEYLAKERRANAGEYFLLEGILQTTIHNDEGDGITTGFYTTGTVLTPHCARTINGKSIFNIQALTDVVVAEMPVAILDSLRYSYSDLKMFGLRVS